MAFHCHGLMRTDIFSEISFHCQELVTMTTTLREVQHLSMEAWPYKRECRGHDPRKEICCTDEVCSIG